MAENSSWRPIWGQDERLKRVTFRLRWEQSLLPQWICSHYEIFFFGSISMIKYWDYWKSEPRPAFLCNFGRSHGAHCKHWVAGGTLCISCRSSKVGPESRHIAVASGSYWSLWSARFGLFRGIFRCFFRGSSSALTESVLVLDSVFDSTWPSTSAFEQRCESHYWTHCAGPSSFLNRPSVQHCHCLVTNAHNFDFTQCSAIHLAPQFEKGLPFVSLYQYYLTLSYELLMTQR